VPKRSTFAARQHRESLAQRCLTQTIVERDQRQRAGLMLQADHGGRCVAVTGLIRDQHGHRHVTVGNHDACAAPNPVG
jgi:hypothetical protein